MIWLEKNFYFFIFVKFSELFCSIFFDTNRLKKKKKSGENIFKKKSYDPLKNPLLKSMVMAQALNLWLWRKR